MTIEEYLLLMDHPDYKSLFADPGTSLSKGVSLLPPGASWSDLDAHVLYVCPPEDLGNLLATGGNLTGESALSFMVSGSLPDLGVRENYQNCNIVTFDQISLLTLYDRLNRIHTRLSHIVYKMQALLCSSADFEGILDYFSGHIGGCIFVVNSGFRLISARYQYLYDAAYHFSDPGRSAAEELLASGFFSELLIDKYLNQKNQKDDYLYIKPLNSQNHRLGHLIIIFPENHPHDWEKILSDHVSRYLSQSLLSFLGSKYRRNESIHQLVSDLIDRNISSETELQERLKIIHFSPPSLYSCIVIKMQETSEVRFDYVLSKLSILYPNTTVDYYQDHVVLIVPCSRHAAIPSIDIGVLSQFCEEYDASAGISYPARSLLSLAALYLQACECMNLGQSFHPAGNKHVFDAQEYYLDTVIHMAFHSVYAPAYNHNPGYYVHPAYIQLHRYDLAKQDNLSEVLITYLHNNQSLNRTSQILYIHRNTLLKKLGKIESLLGHSLEDPRFCEAMLLSYRIVQYSNHVLGLDIEDFQK